MIDKNLDIIYNQKYLVILPNSYKDKLLKSFRYTFKNVIVLENNYVATNSIISFIKKNNFKNIIFINYLIEYEEIIKETKQEKQLSFIFTESLASFSNLHTYENFKKTLELSKEYNTKLGIIDKFLYDSLKENNKYLGEEKISKLLFKFSVPCIFSLLISALYNIVDQIFIGNASYLPLGNTATGIVYPLTVIALALGLFLGDGTAATISINQGKNQTEDTHKSVGTGLTIGLIVSIVLVAVSYIFCEPILKFFGARGEALIFLADAKEYSTWIIAGFPLFLLACVMNPIVRADGSPKFAMLAMAISAIVNIILDPIFIFVANMGMTGAALATFIGQLITFALHVGYFFKSKNFKLKWRSFKPDFKLLGTSLKLGISSFLTQLAIVIISVVNNILLGAFFVATVQNAIGIFTVVFKVFGIVISVAIGVASGGQPILGYNYGAKKLAEEFVNDVEEKHL